MTFTVEHRPLEGRAARLGRSPAAIAASEATHTAIRAYRQPTGFLRAKPSNLAADVSRILNGRQSFPRQLWSRVIA